MNQDHEEGDWLSDEELATRDGITIEEVKELRRKQQDVCDELKELPAIYLWMMAFYGHYKNNVVEVRPETLSAHDLQAAIGMDLVDAANAIDADEFTEDRLDFARKCFIAGALMREMFSVTTDEVAKLGMAVRRGQAAGNAKKSQIASAAKEVAIAELLRRKQANPNRDKTKLLEQMANDPDRRFGSLRTLQKYCGNVDLEESI